MMNVPRLVTYNLFPVPHFFGFSQNSCADKLKVSLFGSKDVLGQLLIVKNLENIANEELHIVKNLENIVNEELHIIKNLENIVNEELHIVKNLEKIVNEELPICHLLMKPINTNGLNGYSNIHFINNQKLKN